MNLQWSPDHPGTVAAHLRDLALEAFTTRDEVARLETSVIDGHVRAVTWPIYTGT